MRAKFVIMVPIAAVLGFIAVQAGRHYLDLQLGERLRAAQAALPKAAEPRSFGSIVVAAAPLRFGTEVTAAALRELPWPQDQIPKGAYAHVAELLGEKAKRFVITAIEENEPVLAGKITGPGQRANLAALLGEGMKAVTVRVDDVVGVAGFVLPGDRVDVLLTRELEKGNPVSDVVLQDLKVLATDQLSDDRANKPAVAHSVTLEVATTQAQRLILAQNVGGRTLVLRPTGETAQEPSRRVTTADLANSPPSVSKAARDDIVATFRPPNVTIAVTRRLERREYSVPSARGD